MRKHFKLRLVAKLKILGDMIRPRCKKVILLIGAVSIVLLCWLYPSHWFYLAWGTVALVAGPILNEWTKKWHIGKQFLGVIFISVMVALGGLLSTLGWNRLTDFKEDQAILVAVAAEWKIMGACIETTQRVIQHDASSASGNTLPYVIIPTLNESSYAITHSETVRSDPDLKHALTVYIIVALKFRHGYEHLMQASYAIPNDKATRQKLLQSFAKKGGPLDYLLGHHKDLGDYLKRKYPKAMRLAEQQVDAEYLDAMKSVQFISNDS